MHRVLIEEARVGEPVEVRGAALRHLRTVLRLAPGDSVELFDGRGRSFLGAIHSVGAGAASIDVLEERIVERESPLDLTLAMALSRGAKPDWIVEKVTELGVSTILPFSCARSAPVPGRSERWQRLADAAARQSGRTMCPRVLAPGSLEDVIAGVGRFERAILFHQGGEVISLAASPPRTGPVLAVTGPEGGFTEPEVRRAYTAGFRIVGLGPRTLRSETAGIIAVGLLEAAWGDLAGGSAKPAAPSGQDFGAASQKGARGRPGEQ